MEALPFFLFALTNGHILLYAVVRGNLDGKMYDRVSAVHVRLGDKDIALESGIVIHAVILHGVAIAYTRRISAVSTGNRRHIERKTENRVAVLERLQTVIEDIGFRTVFEFREVFVSPLKLLLRRR